MLKVCGVEIKGSEARVIVLEKQGTAVTVLETTVKNFTLGDDSQQSAIISFKDAILTFFKNHDIERVAIKQRTQSGNYGAGGVTFKIETLIQLYEKEVIILHTKTIESKVKKMNYDNLKRLKKQEEALKAALSIL